MRDISDITDRYHVQSISSLTSPKRIGGYLVDAGLLTHDQISVALNDQQATGMRFGEIIVARGWLKEQTVEWIVTKVIEPERHSGDPLADSATDLGQAASGQVASGQVASGQTTRWGASQNTPIVATSSGGNLTKSPRPTVVKHPTHGSQPLPLTADTLAQKSSVRRDLPIAKPLPSVGSPDGDVNWVG